MLRRANCQFPTFRDKLSIPFKGQAVQEETNYQSALRNILEELTSHLNRGWSFEIT
jgi:hypothetical protein